MSKVTNGIRVWRRVKKVCNQLFVGTVPTPPPLRRDPTIEKQRTYPRPSNHLQLLGLPVREKVTKFKGTASSVCYDLYGCIQVCVSPEVDSEGKRGEPFWFDVTRIEVLSDTPVMELPDYSKGYIAEGRKGPAEKPMPTS